MSYQLFKMIPKNKVLIRLSLVFNVLFLGTLGLWISQKGGISYVIDKLSFQSSPAEKPTPPSNTYRTTYYFLKTGQFEKWPITSEDIILIGDSLTDQGEWGEIFKNTKIKNRGISGDTTDGVINRLDKIIEGKPKKVFILIGTNDFWKEQKPVESVANNYKIILQKFKEKTPKTQVYIQSNLPVNNQDFSLTINNEQMKGLNEQLKKLAQQFSYKYIDIYSHLLNKNNQLDPQYTTDGAHLNGQGYLVWKEVINPYVNE